MIDENLETAIRKLAQGVELDRGKGGAYQEYLAPAVERVEKVLKVISEELYEEP